MTFKNRIEEVNLLQDKINKYRPLSQHAVKQLKEYYRIGLTYSSNAIEGNSLTETETKIILEDGTTIGGKSVKEHQEALGHSEAYDFLYTLVKSENITEKDIRQFHHLFYYRIDAANAGEYRKESVIITGTDYIPPKPEHVPDLMAGFLGNIRSLRKIKHPVELSAIAHGDFVTIHPFVDGNGRTGRLLMNLILLQEDYVIAIIPPVLRTEYINTLKDYNKGKSKPFIDFISSIVYEAQKDYLRLIEALSEKRDK
jgi:Fic family protein